MAAMTAWSPELQSEANIKHGAGPAPTQVDTLPATPGDLSLEGRINVLLASTPASQASLELPCHYHHFDDSHVAMRLLMWHPCQKDGASCLLQLLDRIDETLTCTFHCGPLALLAAWMEFKSLSLSHQ